MTAQRAAIDRLFAGDRVEDILRRLDAEEGADREWARRPPPRSAPSRRLSLKLALAQVRRGKDWSFEDCMLCEFRIVSRIVYGHDFYEGVRAVIVDKDNAPRWKPATLADVARCRGRAAFRFARRGRIGAAMTDQTALHDPQTEQRATPWTRRLVLFLRIMATISLVKGIYHWSLVLGIGDGSGSTFEQASMPWQAATSSSR